jgi:ribosomal protein S18 acetylase RimI-like enzyme
MNPLSERHPDPVVELGRFSAEDLGPLLDEALVTWDSDFDWDFAPAAELIRDFVQRHALSGFALTRGSRVIGYAYYVREVTKSLIGDLYVIEEFRSVETENALLEAVLAALWRTPGVRRVEAQLMMLSSARNRALPYQQWVRAYPRDFLSKSLADVSQFVPREHPNLTITPWTTCHQDETARLIADAYRGHVDNDFSEQSRSPEGAQRFLISIVQYPGCGTFFDPASFAAIDDSSGVLQGIVLASMVAAKAGHITQVCVAPAQQGTGLGYELVRRSLVALSAHGCRTVSLTVTTANQAAAHLYERMGFTNRREFAAHVWEPR